jgi:hypothetical protein
VRHRFGSFARCVVLGRECCARPRLERASSSAGARSFAGAAQLRTPAQTEKGRTKGGSRKRARAKPQKAGFRPPPPLHAETTTSTTQTLKEASKDVSRKAQQYPGRTRTRRSPDERCAVLFRKKLHLGVSSEIFISSSSRLNSSEVI